MKKLQLIILMLLHVTCYFLIFFVDIHENKRFSQFEPSAASLNPNTKNHNFFYIYIFYWLHSQNINIAQSGACPIIKLGALEIVGKQYKNCKYS